MKIVFVLLIPCLLIIHPVFFQTGIDSCRITYVANEGFLIRTRQHAILIDALFGNISGNWCDQPDSGVINNMINGVRPFDKVDVVLVTHQHADHFSADMVIEFMKRNRSAMLVCPGQVSEILLKKADSQIISRIRSAGSSNDPLQVVSDGIKISGYKFRHGSWMETDSVTGQKTDVHGKTEHLVFFIEADGYSFLHTGDCNTGDSSKFRESGLLNRKTDVGFFDRVFLGPGGSEILNNFTDLKKIVIMHIEPRKQEYFKSFLKDYPAFQVFTKKNEGCLF